MKTIEQDIFIKRKKMMLILILVIGGIYTFFTMSMGVRSSSFFLQIPQGFVWLFTNFIPTAESITVLPLILQTLLSTVMLSITATFTAAIVALLMSIFGSKKTGIHPIIIYFVHLIAMIFRNIPLVVWAMVLILSFKQNEFTGYLAIFFTTFGYLTRAFIEIIEESSDGVMEALTATGATYFQIIFQGVIPMISSQIISWILYMIETNIRDATLVGMLTGTGIGFLFDLYFRSFRYELAGMVTLTIVIAVISLEILSNKVRRLII